MERQTTSPPAAGIPVTSSTGSRTDTVIQLNMSCTVAAANARRNWSRSADCVSATSVFVTDVPTFEPMMIGEKKSKPMMIGIA